MNSIRILGLACASLTLLVIGSSCSPKQVSAPGVTPQPVAARPAGATYALTLDVGEAPAPGKPVELRLSLKDTASGAPPKLMLSHEKLMHLIVVRKDLGSFQHLHPDLQGDGNLTVKVTFPTPGEYTLFADFTPEDGEQQVDRESVTVAGPSPPGVVLTPNADRPSVVGNLKAQLVTEPSQLVPKSPAMLTFRLTDVQTGKPLTNLKPYLGAMGHAVIISADAQSYLHAHPLESTSSAATGDMAGMPGMQHEGHADSGAHPTTADSSTITFHTEFPRAGLYKTWGQFNVGGTVRTVPFVVAVADGPAIH